MDDNTTKLEVFDSPEEMLPLVLLVDDQPFNLMAFRGMVEGQGVNSDESLSGLEAI